MSECEHTTRLIYGDGKCPVRERVKVLESALDEAEKALEQAYYEIQNGRQFITKTLGRIREARKGA